MSAIDEVVSRHTAPGFEIGVSGVPYVSEHVRRQLTADLRRFSIAAFAAFSVVVGVLFRSLAVLLGVMVAALSAAFATFVARALIGMPTDILAPNLWIIAAVLTLSHVVYLTAEWRSRTHEGGGEQAMRESIRLTGPASAWSLAANLLGFASLIFVFGQAAPAVRNLGRDRRRAGDGVRLRVVPALSSRGGSRGGRRPTRRRRGRGDSSPRVIRGLRSPSSSARSRSFRLPGASIRIRPCRRTSAPAAASARGSKPSIAPEAAALSTSSSPTPGAVHSTTTRSSSGSGPFSAGSKSTRRWARCSRLRS